MILREIIDYYEFLGVMNMKKAIFGAGLVLALIGSSLAQKQKTSPEDMQNSGPKQVKTGKQEKNRGINLSSDSSLQAELQNTLDVKKSKVGDEVILKTTQNLKQNGEVLVPKGSNLIGRITEIKQRSKDNATSKIGMIFDRVEGKSLSAPITASIVSITDLHTQNSVGDMLSSDISGSSQTSASGTSGKSSGGGLLGGVGNTVGGVVNSTTQTAASVASGTTQTLGNTTRTLTGTLNGIQISADGSAQGSTTLSSENKNIHLEKGLAFQLRLNSTVQGQE
jgi:hypothetical protein